MPQANSYDCYPDFVIRTPLFSMNNIDGLPSDKGLIPGYVEDLWNNPYVKDAIMLASPSLYEQLDIEIYENRLTDKLIHTFIRYYIRMCFRCTPFGMFAGIGSGKISDETDLYLDDPGSYHLNCRLDMEYLGARVSEWIANPEVRRKLSFRANSSLYKLGGKWRYIEVFFQQGVRKKYRIVSVDRNQVLDDILAEAGLLREWHILVNQLTDWEYERDEAAGFIDELINTQILVPDIYPNLTGREFSNRLQESLKGIKSDRQDIINFQSLCEELSVIKKPGSFHKRYPDVARKAAEDIPAFKPSHLIQSDMGCSYQSANISRELSNKILLGIRILKSLSRPKPNRVLESFAAHFIERFGPQEIPLPLVMDTEFGVGLSGPQGQQMADPGPLLDGLDFPIDTNPSQAVSPHPLLLQKMREAQIFGNIYIKLSKKDLRDLSIRKGKWPRQMYAMCRLAGGHEEPKIVFDLASPGHPSHIMSRFGFLEEIGGLNTHVSELVQNDIMDHPDHIMAEIVHLPEDRTGNILQRPSFYDWEIPYLASEGEKAKVIRVDDILVSVALDKVILKYRTSGKRIQPRLTNAHYYKSGQLPLYQFLAECSNHESESAYFPEWGWLAGANDFVPGIKYGDLILSPPRWRIKIDSDLKKSEKRGEDKYIEIIEWVKKNKLPEKVVWMDGDHEMLISWSNFNIVLSAWESIRKKNYVLFKDNPFNEGSLVESEKGVYANEIIVSFKRSEE